MKLFHKKRHQQVAIGIVVLLAVLVGVTLLNSISSQQQEASQQQQHDQEQREREAQTAAINQISKNANYQKYCTTGVQGIELAGEYLKVTYSRQNIAPVYFKDGEKISCSTNPKVTDTTCGLIRNLQFAPVFLCSIEKVATAVFGNNALQIKTQPVGTAVVIDRVVLERAGYIGIYAVDRAKKPTTLIAASPLLKSGISDIVSIAMPEKMIVGQNYAAAFLVDDGDGAFQANLDGLIKDDSTAIVFALFTASKNIK